MVVGEIIDIIRKTSRGRSRHSRGSSMGSMCIEYGGCFKFLVLGDRGVGKSTICAKYTSQEDPDESTDKKNELYKTCAYISSDRKGKAKQYELEISVANGMYWDGSVEGYKNKLLDSQGYMLVYSKENRQSYMKLVELLSDVQKMKRTDKKLAVVIVGNKSDLDQIKTLQVKDCEHVVLGEFPHFDVSGIANEGLQEAFKCLSQQCSKLFDKPKEEICLEE